MAVKYRIMVRDNGHIKVLPRADIWKVIFCAEKAADNDEYELLAVDIMEGG